MVRLITKLGAAALAAAVFMGAAHAETRLFSVKTDQPNVTVVQAVRDAKALAVAGQTGGATFFRIDNPAGAVPCANRITFTTSNGKVIDGPVDFCATNWELTLALVGGTTGGGTTTTGGTTGTATGTFIPSRNAPQPVAIVTDDPNTTITNVFLRGQEVPIAARQDPYVQINLLGGQQGFECTRDLGLALSDGRRIARLVDVCASDFVVVVALVGGPLPPAPPSNFRPPAVIQPLPPQTPPLPPQVQLPEPPPSTGPEIVTNMQWLFGTSGNRASFAYGIDGTDASEFTAVCQQRSNKITLTLTRTADELGPGGSVPVTFAAGTFSKTYTAQGSPVSEIDGFSHPVLQLSVADPLWASMIKERILQITVGSNSYGLSLSGSAAKAKQFLVACSPAPPPPPPPPPVTQDPGGANTMSFACDDGSYLNVGFDDTTAVVYEFGVQPIVLLAQPYQGGQRWVAGQSQLVGQGEQIFWSNAGYTRTCSRG